MRRVCNSVVIATAKLGIAIAMIAAGAPSSFAQEVATSSGLQVFVTPYFWLSGVDAAIKTPLQRAPEVNAI